MPDLGLLEAFVSLRAELLRYLTLRGASREDAEDVVQEMGEKISSGPMARIEQPRAYLYRMAHNQFLLHRRTAGRRSRREEAWVEVNSGDPPEVDQEPSAETRLMAREQLAILQKAIDALPVRTRMIFRRFRIDGIPRREIADDLGISTSAVEKHLARAYAAVLAASRKIDGGMPGSRSLRQEESQDGA